MSDTVELRERQPRGAAGDHVDVLVVGAGISGISAGYYLQRDCPTRSYAILEARQAIGGTWDLFRYPGLRSDSDLYTFGFSFRPWRSDNAIALAGSILAYVRETAAHYGIDRKIRYGHRVVSASWATEDALWTIDSLVGDEATPRRLTCSFLYVCSGYYDYEGGYMPGWPGMERFRGDVVHPQAWPETLDYEGKRVVVIGSGATAVTLVPEMAKSAAHVTMLQRSPSYIMALPRQDRIAHGLRRALPAGLAHTAARWKNVLLTMAFYTLSRRAPDKIRERLIDGVRRQVGPGVDVERHFTPRYKPWDQRLCFVPDGDFFGAVKSGKASVATDTISTFTETGLELSSGERLEADVIVTATGLRIKLLGGMTLRVDGEEKATSDLYLYKGMMFAGVPNFAVAIGYTNASWTLKCELTSAFVCRVINHLDRTRADWAVPDGGTTPIEEEPTIGLTSGYIQRAAAILPKQGTRKPWKLHQNYALDLAALKFGQLADGTLRFCRRAAPRKAA